MCVSRCWMTWPLCDENDDERFFGYVPENSWMETKLFLQKSLPCIEIHYIANRPTQKSNSNQTVTLHVCVCVREREWTFFSSKYVVFEHVCVEQAFRFWLLYMYYGFSSLPFYLPEVLARTMNNVDYSIKSIYLWVRLIVSVRFSWGIGIWSAYSYLSYPPFDSTNTNGANGLCNKAILAHHKADFKFC